MGRYALLIGISNYNNAGLNPLPSAVKDVDALQQVLLNPEIGGFADGDVTVLKDVEKGAIETAIYHLFKDRKNDDLLLFYFSGHGVTDDRRDFYFSGTSTSKDALPPTAVSSVYVHDLMYRSRSQHQVAILDCCHSGAFPKGMKAKDIDTVDIKLGGVGQAILTATDSSQYAFEQEGFELSLYTHFLVEGLKTGAADRDEDGDVSVDELHVYVEGKVKSVNNSMSPKFFGHKEGHRIVLARAAQDDPKLKFRKKVEKIVKRSNGKISAIARNSLTQKWQELKINSQEAYAIINEVLRPYQEYAKKLENYETALIEMISEEFPFSEVTQEELREYENDLGLREKDFTEIKNRIILNKEREESIQEAFYIFLPELYYIDYDEAFPNSDLESLKKLSFEGRGISVILPIHPKLFDRINVSEILKSLQVDLLNNNSKIKFTIIIDGYYLDKEYNLKEENLIHKLPVAEIYPNFSHSEWQIYYTFYWAENASTLKLDYPNSQNPNKNLYYSSINDYERVDISRLQIFPTHVICSYGEQGVIGILPLSKPNSVLNLSKEWVIGIDMDSVLTNVYINGGDIENNISFGDLHYSITNSDPDSRRGVMEAFFFSTIFNSTIFNSPFQVPSGLNIRNARHNIEETNDVEIVFDGRVLTFINYLRLDQQNLIERFNLNDEKGYTAICLFIESLALQLLAQAIKSNVSKIQWVISYPFRFSQIDKEHYINAWSRSLRNIGQLTGLNVLTEYKNSDFLSQSLAFASYLLAKEKRDLKNAVCINMSDDITDICIWGEHNNTIKLIHQCSLRLTLEHLFSNITLCDPKFLHEIKLISHSVNLYQFSHSSFYREIFMFVRSDNVKHWLIKERENLIGNEKFYNYLQILAIGFAGLHYYIGLILRVIYRDSQEYKVSLSNISMPINVYLGGNGASFVNWLSDTGRFEDSQVGNLFTAMMRYGSLDLPIGDIYLSRLLGDEIACGLAVSTKELFDADKIENGLVAGEPFSVNAQKFDWSSFIKFDSKVEIVNYLTIVRKPEDFVSLPQFLYWFHKHLELNPNISIPPLKGYSLGDPNKTDQENLANTVEDNMQFWNQVVRKLRRNLIVEEGTTTASINLEPPFILSLKALIEVLSEEWANT